MAAATAAISAVTLGLSASPALAADACANAQFRTGPSAHLSDCRAFEQVSPVDKHGNQVRSPNTQAQTAQTQAGWASSGGDTVLYNVAAGASTDDALRGFAYPQLAERTATGWGNQQLTAPAPQAPANGVYSLMRYQLPSADRRGVLFSTGAAFTADNPYMHNAGNGSVDLARVGSVNWLSKPTWAGASPVPGEDALRLQLFAPAGASEDLSTSYFMTRAALTPEDAGRTPLANWALYRWKDGQLSNAGVLPDGTIDPGGSVAAGLALPGGTAGAAGSTSNSMSAQYSYTHSVSEDGSGVLFVSPDPKEATSRPPQLYLAREGQPTVLLSKRTDATEALTGTSGVLSVGGLVGANSQTTAKGNPDVYAVASRDQQVVLFSTVDMLTDDAPVDPLVTKTYRYTVRDGSLTYMSDMDRPTPAPPPAFSPLGMIFNMSDDGSRILYRTTGDELKLWREGLPTIRLSGGVPPAGTVTGGITESRFSADGRTLILMSKVALDGEANHPAGGTRAQTQVYRYVEGDARPTCLSCPSSGMVPQGPASFTNQGVDNGFLGTTDASSLESNRGMSVDGSRVFFTSTSPLSSEDHNAVADVYVWRDGEARLASSGDPASRGDFLVDNSASGNDVFFVSERALVGGDTDDLYDLYDARVGGGFAPPEPKAVPCTGDACQGTVPREKAPFTAAGSLTFAGGGNIAPSAQVPAKIRVSKVKTVRGTSTRVRVKVPGKGKIRTSGSGLRRGHKTAKKAGSYRVTVKLSKRSRSTLRRKHRVRVRVTVRFAPSKGKAQSVRVSVTFKPKARKKKHSSSRSVRRARVLSSGSGKGR